MQNDHWGKAETVIGQEEQPSKHQKLAPKKYPCYEEQISDSVHEEYSEEEDEYDSKSVVHIVVLIEVVHVIPTIRGCALVLSFFVEQEDTRGDQDTDYSQEVDQRLCKGQAPGCPVFHRLD